MVADDISGVSLRYWLQCPDFDDEIIKVENLEDEITRSEKIIGKKEFAVKI